MTFGISRSLSLEEMAASKSRLHDITSPPTSFSSPNSQEFLKLALATLSLLPYSGLSYPVVNSINVVLSGWNSQCNREMERRLDNPCGLFCDFCPCLGEAGRGICSAYEHAGHCFTKSDYRAFQILVRYMLRLGKRSRLSAKPLKRFGSNNRTCACKNLPMCEYSHRQLPLRHSVTSPHLSSIMEEHVKL